MDPAGILMLRSVRIVFEMIGTKTESMNFIKEKFDSDDIIVALTKQPKKCPAIVTCNLYGDLSPHVMVATNALKGIDFIQGSGSVFETLSNEWFINCKNSYRDDEEEPGTVSNHIFFRIISNFCLHHLSNRVKILSRFHSSFHS